MSVSSKVRYFLTAVLIVAASATAYAQIWQPFGTIDYTHDLQPFAPFEIRNFSDQPGQRNGYFFGMDGLYWAMMGERNLIGNPNVQALTINLAPGAPFPAPQVFNGLEDAAPDAKFATGTRYEFGYNLDHHGWLISILDGPKTSEIEQYGFVDEIYENDWIIYDPGGGDDDDDDTELEYVALHPHPAAGRVAILFDAPDGYLDGFWYYDSDDDGSVDTRLDLNGDGLFTYDDMITYLTTYDIVKVSNWTDIDGVELMKTYRFKPTHRGSLIEFYYGARYLRFHDDFRVDAEGGIMTDMNLPVDTAEYDDRTDFWNTIIDNHIVGPQVGLKWYHQKGRWTVNTQGRFTFGYNIQNHEQTGQLGTAFQPNGLDDNIDGIGQPIYAQTVTFRHSKQDQEFSPVVEFRTEVNYHFSKAFALKLGFNATFIDNIRRASRQTAYVLPNMGFTDGGTQDFLATGLYGGFELNH